MHPCLKMFWHAQKNLNKHNNLKTFKYIGQEWNLSCQKSYRQRAQSRQYGRKYSIVIISTEERNPLLNDPEKCTNCALTFYADQSKKHVCANEEDRNLEKPPDLPLRSIRKQSVLQVRRRKRRTEVQLLIRGIQTQERSTILNDMIENLRYREGEDNNI